MAAKVVLVSIFPIDNKYKNKVTEHLIDTDQKRYLLSFDSGEILQLCGYDSVAEFATSTEELDETLRRFSPYMIGDVRRELLTYVEAPKPTPATLPQNDYIQLRHVEVPPQRQLAYRAWREETIFQVVKQSDLVETFLAYHSLISGQPGVMFLSGFSTDPKKYLSVFDSTHYKDIVRQAGDKYITGGNNGLYTRLYSRPELTGHVL